MRVIRECLVFLLAAVLSLCGSACGGSNGGDFAEILLDESVILPDTLALYYPVPVNARPQVAPYMVGSDLSGVAGLNRGFFPPEAAAGLRENGFAVTSGGEYDHIYQVYREMTGGKFITVDAVYSTFHSLCMSIRRELEKGRLRGELESMVSSLVSTLKGMYSAARGSTREAAGKALAFLGVAAELMGLDGDFPTEVKSLVDEEVDLIKRASGSSLSPIFGSMEDYRAYTPPGYYAHHPDLVEFYRASTWLGRMAMPLLSGEYSAARIDETRKTTRMIVLLVGALHLGRVDGSPALLCWDRVFQVTRFLSADTRSLDVAAATRVIREVMGERFPLSRLQDDALMDQLAQRLKEESRGLGEKTVGGSWNAEEPPFRLLETFIDVGAPIFRELAGERIPERRRPRGLDLPAALGSDRALELLDGFYGETSLPGYAEKIRELRKETVDIDPAWSRASLFWSLLKNARMLLRPPGEGYPAFMRGDAWKDRDLYVFLASWVEISGKELVWELMETEKSDPKGAGGKEDPLSIGVTKGYVEPRPEVFALLAADADMLRRGLAERGLLEERTEERLQAFHELAWKLKTMAEKELRNEPLTGEEYGVIQSIGDIIFHLVSIPVEAGEEGLVMVPDTAVIIDAYRDPSGGELFQLALGKPSIYYVIAPVEGKPTLTVGAGYSLYEMMGTGESAPSRDDWRRALTGGERPEAAAWTVSFLK